MAALLPIEKAANKSDIVIALASFTSDNDPWTTSASATKAREALQSFTTNLRADAPSFWSIVEQVLKERVKPLFAKTRNPAITDAGRKNFHPVPLGRFDTSILDPESKPWKVHDPYATTVFEWIIAQYHVRPLANIFRHRTELTWAQSTDKGYLERHFPLLIPPTLSLIDDDNLAYKSRGCSILLQFLKPIKESESDILQRTNLSSVFEDAIKQCFFSLPTITPEDDSIRLLKVAYPALLSVLKTAYQLPTVPTNKKADDQNTYVTGVTRILRDHLIPSFHHISSTNTTSTTSFASFPYPRLSTLLVNQLHDILPELGIHSTKYLQEIIPVLYSTLSNPFGPAHVSLLLASVAAMRAVILNAHPRLWRWRGEILGGVCACWVYAIEEEGEIAERAEKGRGLEGDKSAGEALGVLKKELRGVVYLLKLALENPVDAEGDRGQLGAKEKIGDEVKDLVDADDVLKELLLGDIDPEDGSFFGC